jgi:MFS family permease
MATTAPARRGRAMAVWSTYSAVGVSLGLVLSGSFAGTANWRGGYWLHFMMFCLLAASSGLLPRAPAVPTGGGPRAGLLSAWREPGPLRLSLTFAMLGVMGFGLSTVYPDWFARQHAVPVGQASNILAVANLVMIPGGLLAGALLARGLDDTRLLAGLMLAVAAISLPLFVPGLAEPGRIAAMVGWMLAQGAAIGVVTAALPRVVSNPLQGAAAAGLLSQLAALVTFVTPLLWQPILQTGRWPGFLAVVAVAAAAAWMLFPRRNVTVS